MIYIIIALVVLVAIVALVVRKQNAVAPHKEPITIDDDCCGAHAVCERDSLLSTIEDVVYFEDEELDVLRKRPYDDFSSAEVRMLEEVFYSLREQDVAGWIRSIQLREIDLPDYIKEDALLIVRERRDHTAEAYAQKHKDE